MFDARSSAGRTLFGGSHARDDDGSERKRSGHSATTMEGPLKELSKLESLTTGKAKGPSTQASLDALLNTLRETKDAIAASGTVDPARIQAMAQVVEGKKKDVEDRQKEVYGSMARFGKAWDKVRTSIFAYDWVLICFQKFPTTLPTYSDLFTSATATAALERTVALHMLRTGQFEVAQTFLDVRHFSDFQSNLLLTAHQESGVQIPPKLRTQIVELHEILKGLRSQNVGLALE